MLLEIILSDNYALCYRNYAKLDFKENKDQVKI